MKRFSAIVCVTIVAILGSSYFTTLPGATTETKTTLFSHEILTLDTLTIYNPSSAQCDSDPLVTASNKKINLTKLKEGSIRWMAVSRDLLNRWGGRLNYGDTVELRAGDSSIDGAWIIQDTMNKRFKNRGDLLFDSGRRVRGMWTRVILTKRTIVTRENLLENS